MVKGVICAYLEKMTTSLVWVLKKKDALFYGMTQCMAGIMA